MTEIWEKNLKAMEKWYPSYVNLLREKAEGSTKEEKEKNKGRLTIVEEISWDGEQIFRIGKEGRNLYLNGKRDAKEAVSIWQERLGKIHKYAPAFLVGLGSGLYLKKLCETADETVNIIVYEPSPEIFFYTLRNVDLSEYLEKRMIAWIAEKINEEELEPVLRKLVTLETVEYFKTEVHPNYQELFQEEVLKALRLAGRITTDIILHVNTSIRFAGYMAKNEIQNMRFVLDGYNTMGLAKALERGFPAILVAAGPSLNKNIRELKKAEGRAFILAVDTALKPLLKEKIIPDAFITIDSKKPLVIVETEAVRDIPVIAPVTANYELLKRQKNKKIFYFDGHSLPYLAYLSAGKIMPSASTGGSVACSGFSLLFKMGFSTIILVGQDLAYTGGKSHADGTFQEIMPKENTDGMRFVKGNYEEKVPTRTDFKKFIDWFDEYIEGARKHIGTLRVINATEGGAFIKNTEIMTLHDALEETGGQRTDFKAAVKNMKAELTEDDKEKIENFLWIVSKEFTDIKKDAKKIESVYRKISRISRSRNRNATDYEKQLKKLQKLNRSCESKTAYELIKASMPVAEYIVRSESLEEMDSLEEQTSAVAEKGIKYAGFIRQCAEMLQSYMQEAFADLKVFQEKSI